MTKQLSNKFGGDVNPASVAIGLSPAGSVRVAETRKALTRTGRYAVVAVLVQFLGNFVHLWGEANEATDRWVELPPIVAEALFGPVIVLITSHLLMHSDASRRLEVWPLRLGFAAGAFLSAVHMWAIANEVLDNGMLAVLLPLGVECAAIGSIQQFARGREEFDRLVDDLTVAEADAAEADRRARRHADDEARRRVEVERAEAERVTAEAEAKRRLVAEQRKAAESVVKARKTAGGSTSAADTETAVAAFLAANAGDRDGKGPKLARVAEALGVTARTVQRTEAWKSRPGSSPTPEPSGPKGHEQAEVVDGSSSVNGSAGPSSDLEVV